ARVPGPRLRIVHGAEPGPQSFIGETCGAGSGSHCNHASRTCQPYFAGFNSPKMIPKLPPGPPRPPPAKVKPALLNFSGILNSIIACSGVFPAVTASRA